MRHDGIDGHHFAELLAPGIDLHQFEEKPRRSGAPLPLLVPCFLARTAQHERAGRKGDDHARPALPLAGPGSTASGTAILHGLARRTAPQTQPPRSPGEVGQAPRRAYTIDTIADSRKQ